jgi:hypothetical protein
VVFESFKRQKSSKFQKYDVAKFVGFGLSEWLLYLALFQIKQKKGCQQVHTTFLNLPLF